MDRGYVKLWRKSLDSRTWTNPELWHLWCWCLMKATHKETWVPLQIGNGITEIKLNPGQFVFGRKSASKELVQKPTSIYKRMLKLKNIGNCNIESNKHYSIVTVLNWESYQSDFPEGDKEGDNQVTTRRQPGDTNKHKEHIHFYRAYDEHEVLFRLTNRLGIQTHPSPISPASSSFLRVLPLFAPSFRFRSAFIKFVPSFSRYL